MNKVLLSMFSLAFVLLTSQAVLAKVSWREGKALYKQSCATCHASGKEGGRLKISAHGLEYWAQQVRSPIDEQHSRVLSTMTEEQKKSLIRYLFKYANDDVAERTKKLGCAG